MCGIEHEISSTCIELGNCVVEKVGGRGVYKVSPKCGKHVPQVIGLEVHPMKGDGLGSNGGEVGALVNSLIMGKEKGGGSRSHRMDGPLKHGEGLEEGWGERDVLGALDCFILEVGCLEGSMVAMPILVVVHMVLGANGWVPCKLRDGWVWWKVSVVGHVWVAHTNTSTHKPPTHLQFSYTHPLPKEVVLWMSLMAPTLIGGW